VQAVSPASIQSATEMKRRTWEREAARSASIFRQRTWAIRILVGSAGVLDDAHGCLGEDEEVGGFVDVVVAAELGSDAVDPCAGGGFPCGVPFGFRDLLFDDIGDRGPVGIAEALAGVEVGGNVWKRGHG